MYAEALLQALAEGSPAANASKAQTWYHVFESEVDALNRSILYVSAPPGSPVFSYVNYGSILFVGENVSAHAAQPPYSALVAAALTHSVVSEAEATYYVRVSCAVNGLPLPVYLLSVSTAPKLGVNYTWFNQTLEVYAPPQSTVTIAIVLSQGVELAFRL